MNLAQNKNLNSAWYFDIDFLLKIRDKGNCVLYSIVMKSMYFESFFKNGFSVKSKFSFYGSSVFIL